MQRNHFLGMRLRLTGILPLFLSLLSAQEFRATLQGTIVDPNGAVIPAANVSL